MDLSTDNGKYYIDRLPDQCPYCHKSIIPIIQFGHKNNGYIDAMMFCPNNNCSRAFLAYYVITIGTSNAQYMGRTSQGNLIGRNFSETIIKISASFETIYNQAFSAEQQNLNQICGVGYRKALEFLIKDYSILKNEKEKEKIEKAPLGNVIDKFINDSRIKSVSKRAIWLGNDETHYIRKWEGRDLEDLKKLIDLTVHWIEMETLTSSFESEMPDKNQ